MRKLKVVLWVVFLWLVVGCSRTGTGALAGGGIGGLGGLLVGDAVGHPVAGALLGGALGAGTGALIGHATSSHHRH